MECFDIIIKLLNWHAFDILRNRLFQDSEQQWAAIQYAADPENK